MKTWRLVAGLSQFILAGFVAYGPANGRVIIALVLWASGVYVLFGHGAQGDAR